MPVSPGSIAAKALAAALLAGALIPLAVVEGLAHPFVTPKEILLRLIVAVALPAAALVALPAQRPRFGFLGWSVTGILAAAAVSTALSVDVSTSFWGYAERLTGSLTIALVILYGAMLFWLFRVPSRRRTYLIVWAAVWGVVALWAIAERFVPGFWAQFHGDGRRSVATFGNPIFLADGLLLAAGTGAAVLLAMRRTAWTVAALAATALLAAVAVLFTETRGAYLAAAVGAAVAAAAAAFLSRRRAARLLGIAVPLALLIAVGALWLGRESAFVQGTPTLRRAASVFLTTDPSRVQRFLLWGMAADAFRARPVAGWGLENFDTAVDRVYAPAFTRYSTANSYSDRAHNVFLDVAASAGALGLAAYVAFLLALVLRLRAAARTGILPTASAAAGIGTVAAYAAAGMTSFDTHATLLGLAVGTALLASVTARGAAGDAVRAPRTLLALLAGGAAIALVVFGVVPLARGARIVHRAVTATTAVEVASAADAIGGFRNPYRAHEEQRIANEIFKDVGNGVERGKPPEELLPHAERLLRDAAAARPEHFGIRFTLGNVLLLKAMNGLGTFDEAEAAFEAARPLAPRRQITDYQLGNLFLVKKQYDKAVAAFRRALALDPSIPESHWHLARGLAAAGERGEAAREFTVAWLAGFGEDRPEQEFAFALQMLLAAGDRSMVRSFYRRWAERSDDDPKVFASWAVMSAELGDWDAVREALRRAIELDPTIQSEVPAFLEKYRLPADFLTTEPSTPPSP